MEEFKWNDKPSKSVIKVISSRMTGLDSRPIKRTWWERLLRIPVLFEHFFIYEVLLTNAASNYFKTGEVIAFRSPGGTKFIVMGQISDIRYIVKTVYPRNYIPPAIDAEDRVFKLFSTVAK